jgi:hypothetical protein
VSGHPLLVQVALTDVKSWKFAPIQDGPIEIELNFDFLMRDKESQTAEEEVSIDSPMRIRVAVSPVIPTVSYGSNALQ